MGMELFYSLSDEEILDISGGSLKSVLQNVVGVCGGIAGGLGGFVGGFTVAGNVFTAPISIPAGIVCAGAGGTLGYAAAHEATGAAYDAIVGIFK